MSPKESPPIRLVASIMFWKVDSAGQEVKSVEAKVHAAMGNGSSMSPFYDYNAGLWTHDLDSVVKALQADGAVQAVLEERKERLDGSNVNIKRMVPNVGTDAGNLGTKSVPNSSTKSVPNFRTKSVSHLLAVN